MRANEKIRTYAQECGVKFWQIAEKYGLSEGTFSRRLRHELPEDEQHRILSIIDELHKERG